MNSLSLVGRLARDPELRNTQSGTAVCSFTIACDRRPDKDGKREADFIACTAWGKSAEFVAKYFKKGQRIGLTGRIQVRSYDAQDGSKRYVCEVVADNVEFVESKAQSAAQAPAGPQEFQEVEEADLPF